MATIESGTAAQEPRRVAYALCKCAFATNGVDYVATIGKNRDVLWSMKVLGTRIPTLECDTIGIELAKHEAQWLKETIKVEKQEMRKDVPMTILELNDGDAPISQGARKAP